MAAALWRYNVGLILIAAVVLIWVTSAEVTQIIFETYRHPFVLTWLGASLLFVYLPISYLRAFLAPLFSQAFAYFQRNGGGISSIFGARPAHLLKRRLSSNSLYSYAFSSVPDNDPDEAPRLNGSNDIQLAEFPEGSGPKEAGSPHQIHRIKDTGRDRDGETQGEEEDPLEDLEDGPLMGGPARGDAPDKGGAQQHQDQQLTFQEMVRVAAVLAPMWLLTEYLSNAALSLTSVASTTILSSTSSLFTLLFAVFLGQDSFSLPKILAVLISILGVVMTELGKSSAADDSQLFGADGKDGGGDAHNIVGDFLGLASAVSYGFYTTLLRKYVGGEDGKEEKADMQKLFGLIGLFTAIGLGWLIFPLMWLGWEPSFSLPHSAGLDEDILANALVGSVVSDYFWALSVIWTTPLVATLGLSLTIPLAMMADMVMHGRSYSLVYVLGSAQVFAGFLIANLSDQCKGRWFFKNSDVSRSPTVF